jgi:hypothetical protein
VLRAYKIAVYKSTVISCLKRLVLGTELGATFMLDKDKDSGNWDHTALEHWYDRRFLGDNKGIVSTGLQLEIDVVREKWATSLTAVFHRISLKSARGSVARQWWRAAMLRLRLRSRQ